MDYLTLYADHGGARSLERCICGSGRHLMIVFPLPPSTVSRVGCPVLAGILCLAFLMFVGSAISGFLQGGRDFVQGQRTDSGTSGQIKASFRESLFHIQQHSAASAPGPDKSSSAGVTVLRRSTDWPTLVILALRHYTGSLFRSFAIPAIASRPENPQAPPH